MSQLSLVRSDYRVRPSSEGVSPTARKLFELEWGIKDEDKRNELIADIFEAYGGCQDLGWDGDDAKPVSSRTALNALRFVAALPYGLLDPEISPEPDGEIAIDWYSGEKQCSVSIGPTPRLSFAARMGDNRKLHGAENFDEQIPKYLLQVLLEISHWRSSAD